MVSATWSPDLIVRTYAYLMVFSASGSFFLFLAGFSRAAFELAFLLNGPLPAGSPCSSEEVVIFLLLTAL